MSRPDFAYDSAQIDASRMRLRLRRGRLAIKTTFAAALSSAARA